MSDYWRNREEQAQREYELTTEEYIAQMNEIYDYMIDQINKEINGFYSKYATKEGITMAEAQKRTSQLDIEEYERKAKKYVEEKDFSAQANAEMRLYNLTMKVNRLETLEANIGLEMVSGFDELNTVLGDDLTERALTEMRRQAGILGKTVQDNAKKASSIVGASFHNATFSDRIWMYQGMLRNELDSLLRQGLIQGYGPLELARHLNNLFDTGKYNCERLMRTELTRVQSDAQLESFIANGFDEYQFNALGTACEICRALDEQHFKVSDAEPGVNLPPMHPNCMCAVSAWMDDALYQQWLDSYSSHGMSYEDWLNNRPTAVEGIEKLPSEIYAENADKIHSTLHDIEESTRGYDHESGSALDLYGNILNTSNGEAHCVEIPDEFLAGNIVTHNHPSGGCFSTGDIQSMIGGGVYELRASTPQGTYHSLRVGDSGLIDDAIVEAYNKCAPITDACHRMQEDAKAGILTKRDLGDFTILSQYRSVAQEAWLQEHAREYGLIYEKGEI